MQQSLFNTQIEIGDIVISKHTNQKIKVTKIKKYFIVGILVGYIFTDRSSTDIRILSYENIQ